MATYQICGQQIVILADELRRKYHTDLDAAGVRVCYLFAYAPTDEQGQPKGPALKLHGYPCAATVKVNNLKQRVQGMADCTIEIDGDSWGKRPNDEQLAIIDHELEHIVVEEIRKTNDGVRIFEVDDIGRPKTWLKNHDFHGGGFQAIVDRWKAAALEAKHCIDFSRVLTQAMLFVERIGNGALVPVRETLAEVVDEVNAGALGPDVTASMSPDRSVPEAGVAKSKRGRPKKVEEVPV